MSRIGDYVIEKEENGELEHDFNPPETDNSESTGIEIDDSVPIPSHLVERSNLNSKFGHLPFEKMDTGNSFALEGLTEKEFTALRARVSRANKREIGNFALQTVNKHDDGAVDARVFRIE